MKRGLRGVLITVLFCLSATSVLHAQTPEADQGPKLYPAWKMTRLVNGATPTPTAATPQEVAIVLFIPLADDTRLIEVSTGQEVVYERQASGTYKGSVLVPGAFTFSAELKIVDDKTRTVTSKTTTGAITLTSNLIYNLLEDKYFLMMEGDRKISEYSMFQECLGRKNVTPGAAWTTPDLLIPVRIDKEADVLYLGSKAFPAKAGGYELRTEQKFGTGTQVTTQTLTAATDGSFALRYHGIVDKRDDCEMIYESVLKPFDGDFDALFARAKALGEANRR